MGCPLLSSPALWRRLRPSLAPRFAGFTVPAQPTQDNRNGRLISCAGGQALPVPLGLRIVRDASGSFLPQGVA